MKAIKIIKYIFEHRINIIKTIYYNFFSPHIIRESNCYVMISFHTKLRFEKYSTIHIKSGILLFEHHNNMDIGGVTTVTLCKNSKWVANRSIIHSNSCIVVFGDGLLETGSYFFLNPLSIIRVRERITIGNNCALARNVYLSDTDSHRIYFNGTIKDEALPTTIGNNVWIGANSIILKVVNIQDNSIVGAGTVIVKTPETNGLIINTKNLKTIPGYTFKF